MAQYVNPTRMELTRIRKRLQTAERGHKLLKDKRDEMVRRFVEIIKQNMQLRCDIEDKLSRAMNRFSIARAFMGNAAVSEALLCPAKQARISTGLRNIMSVDVPTIRLVESDEPIDLPYSFAFTSAELDGSVLDLTALFPSLVQLAEIEKTCNMLADEIQKTRRRVNALEHVMIPEMRQQIKYIRMKLDENERGNLSRLMKVKDLLQQDITS